MLFLKLGPGCILLPDNRPVKIQLRRKKKKKNNPTRMHTEKVVRFADMAGMQYYFFPTDFYYPTPPPNTTTTATTHGQHQGLVPVKRPIDDETDADDAHLKSAAEVAADKNSRSYKVVKFPALTINHIPTQKVASKRNVLYK
ncbi:hypothetical protein Pfo_028378 [Paulownia fortunei]|nr:hypothetical protein Pfo_028378 [Paulownia fortunei]